MEQQTQKKEQYALLASQIQSLIEGEPDQIANLANASAAINEALENINWAGFYLVKDGCLVLGPFQGKPACIRIPFGKGVCGTAAKKIKRSLSWMSINFQGILRVTVHLAQRLSFRFTIKMVRLQLF